MEQGKSVAEMASRGWILNFRKWLDERAQNQLRQLRDMLVSCALSDGKDTVKWMWEKYGFSL
jgi:pyridoxine/pyridoxamine 5'-phosphate oxidase